MGAGILKGANPILMAGVAAILIALASMAILIILYKEK